MGVSRVGKVLAGLLCGLLLAVAGVAWLALDRAPAVPEAPHPTVADIARANALLNQHDPRRALPGVARAAVLTQHEAELLLAQAAIRLHLPPRAQVRVSPGSATLAGSLPLTLAGHALWLNLGVELRGATGPRATPASEPAALPEIAAVRVGALPLPAWLARAGLPLAVRGLGLEPQAELALQTVNRVDLRNRHLVVGFAWPEHLDQRLADSLLPAREQARLLPYAETLSRLTHQLQRELGPRRAVPLPRLLQPMFALAAQQSRSSRQPALENRAALLALTCLVNGRGLSVLAPGRDWPRSAPLEITLAGRTDTPKHYLVSATLAIEGGGPLSNAIGLYKEISDSKGGSGFSFNDLAADRAGTRFGLLATGAPETVQARLAAGIDEGDLLPAIADLPEDMQAPEFTRRFGGVDAPEYRRMAAEIERRLDALPLLAAPGAVIATR